MKIAAVEIALPQPGASGRVAALQGTLSLPEAARGLVAFAHGSGSSRLSPRNTYVAEVLQRDRIATLLFDLLTAQEDRDRAARFDIAQRRPAATSRCHRRDGAAFSSRRRRCSTGSV